MNTEEKIKHAEFEGNRHFCSHCNKVQPVELTFFNPDEDTEPTLLVRLVCKEAIDFIEKL